MTRKHQFNYGFDEKPQFVKDAEREELLRLHNQKIARERMTELDRAFEWSEHLHPHLLVTTE